MPDDPSATYRGFRSQALYVLHRLLTDPDRADLIFRPEGDEDLAIFDRDSNLVEAVQVKDYSSPLALAHFKPKSSQGFFGRLRFRMKAEPQCRTRIATYGPLGPELKGAIENEAKPRRDVVRKIKQGSDWKDDAEIGDSLGSLDGNVEILDREKLESEIRETLKDTAIGGDIDAAMDLLMYWIFDASEHARDVSETLLIEKIQVIGDFLIDTRNFCAEWGTSIIPIKVTDLSSERTKELLSEYRRGVDARFEHILAKADSPRPDLMQELRSNFSKYTVVVVRGASGQGKSSLCLRYLNDHCADGIRFQVKHLESPQQAMRIAKTLESHIRKLRLPATVFLDVSPQTVGWTDLIAEFSSSGIRALVCVREEDFLRASVSEHQFDHGVISMQQVHREEAEGIYRSLTTNGESKTLNFEDAWSQFEDGGGGPLMEFTHLVIAGDSLASRISQQIQRLRSDAEAGTNKILVRHLNLLALAAIGNAAGSRVSFQRLCDEVGLDRITDPIRMIENEYFFRIVEEGGQSYIAGLHSFRSQAIVEAFFGDDHELMSEYAARTVQLVVDEDLRSFLLHAFVEDGVSSARLIETLMAFSPENWTQVCRISEALIWFGIHRYEEANRDSISKLIGKYQKAWFLVCDVFVGLQGTSAALAASFPNFEPPDAPMTPKGEVFLPLKEWLKISTAPVAPLGERDLGNIGDLMFWIGFSKAEGAIPESLHQMTLDVSDEALRCEDIGRWVMGRSEMTDSGFQQWHGSISEQLRLKFLKETHSVDLTDDGTEISVVYALTPVQESGRHGITSINSNLNRATMWRVNLLRLLYPRHNLYSGKAFGAAELRFAAGFDESRKQIRSSNLHAPLGVHLNANFLNLVAYRHERPGTWRNYVDEIIAYRKSAISFANKVAKFWNMLLGASESRRRTMVGYPTKDNEKLSQNNFPPKFPLVSVDRFGFIGDSDSSRCEDSGAKGRKSQYDRSAFFGRFSRWQKAIGDYSSNFSAFAKHSIEVSLRFRSGNPDFSNPDSGHDLGHLSLACSSMAWEALKPVQTEFRQHFLHYLGDRRLEEIEKQERIALEKLWAAVVTMQYHRSTVKKNPVARALNGIRNNRDGFPGYLQKALDRDPDRRVIVRPKPVVLDAELCLVVVCDYSNWNLLESDASAIAEDLASAARAQSRRPYEWQGIVNDWPSIALVKTINQKVWAPVFVKISTMVMAASDDGFEAKFHHRAFSEATIQEFEQTTVELHNNPTIRAVHEVHETLVVLSAAIEIHMEILEYVSKEHLKDPEVVRITSRYLEEVRKAWRNFTDACVRTKVLILHSENNSKDLWCQQIEEIETACTDILTSELFDEKPSLNVVDIARKGGQFREGCEQFRVLYSEVIGLSLGAPQFEE